MNQDLVKISAKIDFRIYEKFGNPLMQALKVVIGLFSNSAHLAFLERFGTLRETWSVSNLLTNAGRAQIALLLGDGTATPFGWLAVGTSSTAPAAGQTALGAEIVDSGLARAAATFSRITTSVADDTAQFLVLWSVSGSKTIEEIGYFNASSAGTMGGRALSSSKSVVSGETVTGIYTVQIS